MSYALLSDFDGTFVNDRMELDSYSLSFINEFLKENKICIVSTTSYSFLNDFTKRYNINCDIYSLSSGIARINDNVIMSLIPKKVINNFFTKYNDYIYTAYSESDKETYIFHYHERLDLLYPKVNRKIIDELPCDIPSLTIAISKNKITSFYEDLENLELNYRIIASDKNRDIINIYKSAVSKLDAVYLIKSEYPDKKIIGATDSYYDFDMISNCEIKIAMLNSDDELKQNVDIITDYDNNNSGLFRKLNDICHLK